MPVRERWAPGPGRRPGAGYLSGSAGIARSPVPTGRSATGTRHRLPDRHDRVPARPAGPPRARRGPRGGPRRRATAPREDASARRLPSLTVRQILRRGRRLLMFDLLLPGGTVVDGTGAAPRPADIAVRNGRIQAVGDPGTITGEAAGSFDASGLVVTPGFVDPHTHYDAQLFWDPGASPSKSTASPRSSAQLRVHARTPPSGRRDYTRRMMAKVEGMPLAALRPASTGHGRASPTTSGASTATRGERRLPRGHCALRRYVMGPSAVGSEATASRSRHGWPAGRVDRGRRARFSTTLSRTHSTATASPSPRAGHRGTSCSRCAPSGPAEGTTLEGVVAAASTSSATTTSTCWSPCPWRPGGRSTGTS